MRHIRIVILFLLVAIVGNSVFAQKKIYCMGTVYGSDTIPMFDLREVTVVSSHMLLTDAEIRKNKKLIRNTKKMLPYALEGKRRLDALELQISQMPRRERKAAIKKAEKDLLEQYTDELKKCTFSQGLVLIKLIDRETGRTSYEIVDELRGRLRASFYQTFARLFKFNLKNGFDPQHDKQDELLDRVVRSIQLGQV